MGESLFFSDKIKLLGAFRLKFKYVAKLTLPPSQSHYIYSEVWCLAASCCEVFFQFQ